MVLDISATTIDQDKSIVQNIPSAESKGLSRFLCFYPSANDELLLHRISQFYFLSAGYHFDTEDGDKLIPGFLDSIIGIQQGETRSFPLVFPESWAQENLRGIHAQFSVSAFLYEGPPLCLPKEHHKKQKASASV